jgi:pimeloyl-ACP methyl ester carboxylesterase
MRWLTGFCMGALLLVNSCAFRELAGNVEELDRLATVRVRCLDVDGTSPRLVMVLGADSKTVVNYAIVYGAGPESVRVPAGDYYVAAFEDRNENFKRDAAEPAAFYGRPDRIAIRAGETSPVLDIRFRDGDELPLDVAMNIDRAELTASLDLRSAELGPALEVGDVVSLNSAQISPENARLGMWEPWKFIENGLLGLYLLEEYDPNRTPVVFVHGIGGTPRDFEALIESLDTRKFQPAVFFYPSSLRIDDLGRCLFKALSTLVLRFSTAGKEPTEVVLVAHSMGGLVARRAIDEYLRVGHLDYLRAFVTLASPLDGMVSAGAGVKWAPTVMPCWFDLAPGSAFLKTLFARPLPDDLPYFLFFAHGSGDGDGTVSLSSQIRVEAQRQARTVVGINSDHVGILSDEETLWRFNRLLANEFAR